MKARLFSVNPDPVTLLNGPLRIDRVMPGKPKGKAFVSIVIADVRVRFYPNDWSREETEDSVVKAVSGRAIANDFAEKYGLLGVFILPKGVLVSDTKAVARHARQVRKGLRERWMASVKVADARFKASGGNLRMVLNTERAAARHLGLRKPWLAPIVESDMSRVAKRLKEEREAEAADRVVRYYQFASAVSGIKHDIKGDIQ